MRRACSTQSWRRQIIQRAHDAGREVIVDPRPEHKDCYRGCDYITPNWRESRALLGLPWVEPVAENTHATARALATELGTNVLLTLGPHGILFCSRDASDELSMPTLALEVFDVSGAGDTVVAAFALAKAGGLRNEVAIALANKAASIVVGKFGTATVTVEELSGAGLDNLRLVTRAGLARWRHACGRTARPSSASTARSTCFMAGISTS